MLYGEKNKEKLRSMAFGYGNKEDGSIIPKYSMNEESIDPDAAKQLIMNQLLDEGNSRLNMATFCQTYMEDQAEELMAELKDLTRETLENCLDKGMTSRNAIKEAITRKLDDYLYKKTKREPLIVPILLEL